MKFIDTHAHLYLGNFNADRDKVIHNAVAAGVEKIVLPNIDSGSINSLKALCNSYPETMLPLIGLHPTSVKNNWLEEIEMVKSELKSGYYYGIGETGIDLYWDKTFIENQKTAFKLQLELTLEYKLPVIIHARESFEVIFEVLDYYKNEGIKGIFHAFTGTPDQAKKIISDYGFLLGIGGIVTFKNSTLKSVLENISMEYLVLETDSPFLAPVPNRGKRNESGYLIYIAQKIAEIKKCSVEKVADITTKNAINLFGIKT